VSWQIIYHHEVAEDLANLGSHQAKMALKVIETRIRNGESEKTGKPLSGELAGCRRIRTSDLRIVYRVHAEIIEVLIIAVGPRRNDEVYKVVGKRT